MLIDIVTPARAQMTPGVHTELRTQLNRSCRVTMVGGNLVANAKSETSGVCARVYRGGVYGFSSMAECSADAAAARTRRSGFGTNRAKRCCHHRQLEEHHFTS